jgi:predicted DNA-binding transcriptional regulator AlpA
MATDLVTTSWYTTSELAEFLGIDASSLRRWRTARPPQGPPFVRISARRTLYNSQDVANWLQSRRIAPAGP